MNRRQKSLRYSIFDGTFYNLMVGFGESFFSAFAVFLQATILQIGLLGSLPQTLGSLSEVFSDRLIRKIGSRKKIVVLGSFMQGLVYIPIMLVFLFGTHKAILLIVFVTLYWILGMIMVPAWNSWMGDLVDAQKRGEYFGNRTKIGGISNFFAFISAGVILSLFNNDFAYWGYAIIFSIAFASRMASVFFLLKKYEPAYHIEPIRYRFRTFIRNIWGSNFGRLALYLVFMNFGVYIASPFFTPFILRDLGFGYLQFTIIQAAAMIIKFASMPVWGKAVDTFGARKVLSLSGVIMPFVPVLWIFSHNFHYLIMIQLIAGFIWAGFEIATLNFMFDTTDHLKRAAMVAYYNVLNGLSFIIGSLLGGFIAEHNTVFWSPYLLVFGLSFVVRLISSMIFLPNLNEVRDVQPIGYDKLLFKIISNVPTQGFVLSIIPLARRKHKR